MHATPKSNATCRSSSNSSRRCAISDEIEAKLQDNPAVRKEFQEAKGDTEFVTDGVFVNTRNDDGGNEWREMKVAIITKQERGESALPEDWDSRDLPAPTVSAATAAVESKPECVGG
ncbi:hypothetical protein FACS189454_08790 [Planctomycetales bacterium]|nr:hypothetical protein FACS189454_08790 [Planctomycetales bacterium]